MPSSIILRAIETNLTNEDPKAEKMNPYFTLSVGPNKAKSAVCKKGGVHPTWDNEVSVKQKKDKHFALFEIKAARGLLPDKKIGSCQIDLQELGADKTQKWYEILHKNKAVGQVLIEASLSTEAIKTEENKTKSLGHLGETQPVEAAEQQRVIAQSAGNINQPDSEAIQQQTVEEVQVVETFVPVQEVVTQPEHVVVEHVVVEEQPQVGYVEPELLNVPAKEDRLDESNIEDVPYEREFGEEGAYEIRVNRPQPAF